MIYKILRDIRIDMEICLIEGWDMLEYLNRLRYELNSLGKRYKKKEINIDKD